MSTGELLNLIASGLAGLVGSIAAWFAWRGWLGQRRLADAKAIRIAWDYLRLRPPKRLAIFVSITARRNRVVPIRAVLAARNTEVKGTPASGSTFRRPLDEGQSLTVQFDFEDARRVHLDPQLGPIRWIDWYDAEERRHRSRIEERWLAAIAGEPPAVNESIT